MNDSQVPPEDREPSADEPRSAGSEVPNPEGPGSGGSRPEDSRERPEGSKEGVEEPRLAPIPEEGTSAPADAGRVFGRSGVRPAPFVPGRTDGPAGAPADGPDDRRSDPGGVGRQATTTPSPAGGNAPSEEEIKQIRRRGMTASILALAALLVGLLPIPLGLPVGLGLGIAAFGLAISALRAGRRARVPVPGVIPALLVGSVSLLLAAAVAIFAAMFWDEWSAYNDCISGGNTQAARERCTDEFVERIEDRVGPLPTTMR
ncbi:MAG TPA: hypothetical protein VI076_05705 [Actinopolymorphaceae bacterium]